MTDFPASGGEVVAMVSISLHPRGIRTRDPEILGLAPVSLEWQKVGAQADVLEMHGTTHGMPEGRMYEVAGRAAAAGEQLGLALAALSDAHEWLDPANEEKRTRDMGARATAEVAGYYAKGAAHGLANVAIRTLMTHPSTADGLNIAFKSAKGFAPFSEAPGAWVSLNAHVAAKVVDAIPDNFGPAVQSLGSLLVDLVEDPQWDALADRRDVDYHRWRPQSIAGGVAPQTPWDSSVPGSRFMELDFTSRYVPTEPTAIVAEATAGVIALGGRMGTWLDHWFVAVNELMTEQESSAIFRTDSQADG